MNTDKDSTAIHYWLELLLFDIIKLNLLLGDTDWQFELFSHP